MKDRRLLLCSLALLLASSLAAADAEALFVRRVLPLFHDKCLACHGNDEAKIKGGLDLRTLESARVGGDSFRSAFEPGKPEVSPLFRAITRTDSDWQPMPPKEADALTAEQTGWLKEWIAGGAPWPDAEKQKSIAAAHAEKWSAEDGVVMKTSGGLSADWTNRRYKPEGMWAYQPVRRPVVPAAPAAREREKSNSAFSPSPPLPISPSSSNPIDA
ncbi:MAG: hypothetical protein RLZZ15_3864, partial [Verrucomicrobiota bacterium]